MRKFGLSLLMVAVPYAALSQESASSPEEYACALAGDCAEQDSTSAEESATPSGTPRVSATRGFSLGRPTGNTNNRAPAPKQRQVASSNRQPRPATSQPGRVNLRLAFGSGSSTLSPAAQAEVRAFAQALQQPRLSTMRVRIEGHTDSAGSRASNLNLSQKRAQAVADYLVSQGVAQGRLEVRGYGFDRPLPGRRASDSSNRRVEAVRIS